MKWTALPENPALPKWTVPSENFAELKWVVPPEKRARSKRTMLPANRLVIPPPATTPVADRQERPQPFPLGITQITPPHVHINDQGAE